MTGEREKELLRRIEWLERRVHELEARPTTQHHHYHTHPRYPVFLPAPVPTYPAVPWAPYPVWCGAQGMTQGVAGAIGTTASYTS